jgi:putative ABC transport system permease protein
MRTNPFSSRHPRSLLVALGLLAISLGVTLIASASQTTVVAVEQDLGRYWRTTYDILVRPGGSRSPIEEQYGLASANHLSGIWGGITSEQYETIKAIPGVELAAPIAMIGYVTGGTSSGEVAFPPAPGVYVLEQTHVVDDGARLYEIPAFQSSYYYFDRNPHDPTSDQGSPHDQIGELIVNQPAATVNGGVLFPFLLAAIDPAMEAALVGLDQAVIKGDYLLPDEAVTAPQVEMVSDTAPPMINLPVLLNVTNYISLTHKMELKQLLLPSSVRTVDDIAAQGGIAYLATLPQQSIVLAETEGSEVYQRMFERLAPQFFGVASARGPEMLLGSGAIGSTPGPIHYRQTQAPVDYTGLALEIVPTGTDADGDGWPRYRESIRDVEFDAVGLWQPKGIFDIERIPSPDDVHRIPLETYFPPVALLRYDEQGHAIQPPRTLYPTLNPEGYLQSPPLILTTLAAARELRGDEVISGIRVRVAGVNRLSPANQRKIETVAGEIVRLTGLDVDIMIGSSPTRVLVRVPGVGYVEEQWIQKNVTALYQQRVQAGHLILLVALLSIGALFVLDLAWAEVVARRRTIALQKALGWRSSTVFGQVLGHLLLVSAVAAPLGALLAWATAGLWGWQPPSARLLVGVPLLVVALSLLGALYPAWLAARVPPIAGLQQGSLRATAGRPGRTFLPPRSLLLLAWQGLARRWSRSALGGLTAMLSAALLVLMLAVTVDRQGAMSGTLLGEFILVRIESYHYAIVAIGFGLAALSLANSLLAGVLERGREIGVLKAVGWRTATVARLFVAEGTLLGLLGGLAGAALGLALFAGLYQSVPASLGWIAAVGVLAPLLVGALAALYPARVAARIPPAEAVRYE